MLLKLHSYWAILALILLLIAVVFFVYTWLTKKEFTDKHLRIALFTLIVYHIQLILGLGWYFMSPAYKYLKEFGMSATMKESTMRLHIAEHPIFMIIAITLITIGFSKHKKKIEDSSKLKTLTIFYGLALIFALSRIPWQQWLQ